MCISDSAFDEELKFPLKAVAFDYDFYCHLTQTSLGASQVNERSLFNRGYWARNQRIWVLRLVKYLNRGIVHVVNKPLASCFQKKEQDAVFVDRVLR